MFPVSPEPGPAPGVRLHQRGVLLPRLQRARQQVVRRQEGRAQRCRTDSAIKNQYISISLFQLVVCGNLRRSILTARRCSGSVKGYTDTPSPADGYRINKTLLMLIIVSCWYNTCQLRFCDHVFYSQYIHYYAENCEYAQYLKWYKRYLAWQGDSWLVTYQSYLMTHLDTELHCQQRTTAASIADPCRPTGIESL